MLKLSLALNHSDYRNCQVWCWVKLGLQRAAEKAVWLMGREGGNP